MSILKRFCILMLCAAFFASCGTTGKSAVQTEGQQTAESSEKTVEEKAKSEKKIAREKKKKGKSSKAKSGDYLVPINAAVYEGDYSGAYDLLSTPDNIAYLGSDDIYNMDAGMLKLYSGDNEAAIKHLEPVADMQKLNDKYGDASKIELSTLLLDPYSQPYSAYDYEDMYAVIFDAMAKLDDPETADGAFQDLKNIREMLLAMDQYKQILTSKMDDSGYIADDEKSGKGAEKAGVVFSNSALANYLALLYNKYNDRDGDQRGYFYQQMEKSYMQSSYSGQKMPSSVAVEKEDLKVGKGRLNIIALAGLMDEKKEVVESTLNPLGIVINMVSVASAAIPDLATILTGGFSNRTMNVKYPVLTPRENYKAVEIANVSVAGKPVELDLIEDVNGIANACMKRDQEFDKKRSKFRTTSRWVTAGATYAAAVYAGNKVGGFGATIASVAAGTTLDLTLDKIEKNDRADIRGAHFFPAKVLAGGITLDPGEYEVTIGFSNGETITKTVEVKANRLNLLQLNCQEQ